MKNMEVINEIDILLNKYCEDCFVRSHLRKEKGKTVAHDFCIHVCTVGEQIKETGKKLITK
ncbi:uncharacterized protein DUF2602 [Psychrobacillus insolitus]|uniref:Uncharacterized protein DUF2602 n=1 Tax=Psychrobacillus insolitus TaxID=1461 RepID=A0A2W7ML51_9BACI|nr:zinc-finger domain-containing protein [Psychrobacillus insolitus]PZX07605.1 uncharacterized protein DUF2602 [Psychrobacillus insolitus]